LAKRGQGRFFVCLLYYGVLNHSAIPASRSRFGKAGAIHNPRSAFVRRYAPRSLLYAFLRITIHEPRIAVILNIFGQFLTSPVDFNPAPKNSHVLYVLFSRYYPMPCALCSMLSWWHKKCYHDYYGRIIRQPCRSRWFLIIQKIEKSH
jgi:hypothetical protein